MRTVLDPACCFCVMTCIARSCYVVTGRMALDAMCKVCRVHERAVSCAVNSQKPEVSSRGCVPHPAAGLCPTPRWGSAPNPIFTLSCVFTTHNWNPGRRQQTLPSVLR
eukprot:2308797-Prymnesium_polylepis.1